MNQPHIDFFESNLILLKQHHLSIYKQITDNPPPPVGEISYAPNGNPNITIANHEGIRVILHNEIHPEQENTDFLEKIPVDHKGFVAILGMGLGYYAMDIFKKRPLIQHLALFELEPGIFIQALHHIDLSPILKDPRLILSIGAEFTFAKILAPAYSTLQLENANVFHHSPSFRYNLKGYNQLKEDLFTYINGLNVGGSTTRFLGKIFMNNRFKHVSTIHHNMLLEQINNKFDNIPAILVAGGPSLDKNIHLLKQVQEKAVIIAVDSVLPALIANDVHPHFLTCIDSNNLTFEKFADSIPEVKDIALICSSWINLKTPRIFPAAQIFWTFTGRYIEAWLNSLFEGKIVTGGASTVAHLNLISAHMLGCDPVVFIGQDLAYPSSDSSSHAKNTILQGTAPENKLQNHTPGETVVGINGKLLRTNRSFLSMKEFFESAISSSNKTHINATEGGANIEGAKNLTLQETLDNHCKTEVNVKNSLKTFYSNLETINPDKMLAEFNKKLRTITKLLKTIKKTDNLTTSLLKQLKKLKENRKPLKSFTMLPPQQQKQINKIDKAHKNMDKAVEIWKLLEEITMEGLKESKRQKSEIATLQNNPDKYTEWLIKNLERRLDIDKVRKETLTLLSDNLNMVILFHQKEKKYLKQNKLKLAKHYFNSENYLLAKPLLEKLWEITPKSSKICFYLGCIAAQSNMLKQANNYFQTAINYDPKLKSQIDLYMQKNGEEFLKFARYFHTQPGREISVKYMVQKGLEYHPDSSELKKEMETIVKKEMETIKSNLDGLFSAGDFDNAIKVLNEAIKVDIQFATYWESIGDTLQSAGQNQDAILAYEKCFVNLPDNILLLKKIGDCYMNCNQLEAAKTAYQQLKLKLKKEIAP